MMDGMTMRLRILLHLLFPLLLLLAGCAESRPEKTVMDPLWPEKGAPDILHALGEDIAAFQSATGRMPDSLAVLDQSGIATGGPYAKQAFAYHPAGIGVLREGWRVVAADDRVRTQSKVWCVIRPPVRMSNAPSLRVVEVPLVELREAARAASGVR